jgi:hypothetical protein
MIIGITLFGEEFPPRNMYNLRAYENINF